MYGESRSVQDAPGVVAWSLAGYLVVFSLSACAADSDGAAQTFAGRDSAGIQIVEHAAEALEMDAEFRLSSRPQVRVGVQDGAPEQQFARINGAFRYADGALVVLDRGAREVKVFDAAGNFLNGIGAEGEGPGEFMDPARLVRASEGTLLVWDPATNRVSRFRRDGEFLESTNFESRAVVDMAARPDGAILVVLDEPPRTSGPPGSGRMRNAGSLARITPDGDVVTIAAFAGTEWETRRTAAGIQIRRPWYFPRLLSALTTDAVWTSDGTEWQLVRRRVADGKIDRIVRFLQPAESFTPSRIREIHSAELEAAESTSAREALARRQEQTEYPPTIPPIQDLFVDVEGRIWVGRLEAPAFSLPSGMGRVATRWVVLDGEGLQVLGTISLPPRRRPLYADGEGVLVVTADELDVPYLEWWPFV